MKRIDGNIVMAEEEFNKIKEHLLSYSDDIVNSHDNLQQSNPNPIPREEILEYADEELFHLLEQIKAV